MNYVSDDCRLLLGAAPETLTTGQPFATRIHPEDRDRVWREIQSALSSHDLYVVEYRLQHASGQWRSVCERGWILPGLAGKINGLEGHVTDLTWRMEEERNRRIMEGRLRRAQKMEAIGTLAGGVAHNFNNVLAGILGSAELMRMDIEPKHPAREFLDQIFVAGQRAREMVQQVLTFSQWRENERILIQLQPLVRECVKLLRATIPAMVDISCQVDPECPAVLADPTQIHQVVMNLCTNVWQTLPEHGGQIRVNLARCQITETLAAAQAGLVPGPGVRLTISDQGGRLNQSEPERLFEPLSPHPSDAEDSGLSLSVVHGIVKSHQGVFTLKNEPGLCAQFHVYLPAQGVETEPPVESPTVLSSNHERILLVDDDDIAGLTTEKILHRFGYRVKWFKHPEAALADFQAHPGDYDFLLTDLAMPGMTGNHLAAAVRRLRPAIPTLIITGMIDPAILKQVREAGFGNVLFKPVSPAILSAEIARRLGHPTP
jgi:signal transduction histidine kinase